LTTAARGTGSEFIAFVQRVLCTTTDGTALYLSDAVSVREEKGGYFVVVKHGSRISVPFWHRLVVLFFLSQICSLADKFCLVIFVSE
jgi:hypothetical protein